MLVKVIIALVIMLWLVSLFLSFILSLDIVMILFSFNCLQLVREGRFTNCWFVVYKRLKASIALKKDQHSVF
jgi:hypothetical protein